MAFLILVRWHVYIDSAPLAWNAYITGILFIKILRYILIVSLLSFLVWYKNIESCFKSIGKCYGFKSILCTVATLNIVMNSGEVYVGITGFFPICVQIIPLYTTATSTTDNYIHMQSTRCDEMFLFYHILTQCIPLSPCGIIAIHGKYKILICNLWYQPC